MFIKKIYFLILFFVFSGKIFPTSIKIISTGDIIPHLNVQKYCIKAGTCDIIFSRITKLLKTADICFANFESSINIEKKISGYPRFNASPSLLKAMKKAGINALSLANNHSLDMGKQGLKQTRYYASKNGFIHNGISSNKKAMFMPVYFMKKGIKISFLSLTTITNGLKNPLGINPPKVIVFSWKVWKKILKIIKIMKKNSNFAVVSIHFGKEYTDYPTKTQKNIAHLLVKAGADLILGNHSHHIQRPEIIKKQNGKIAVISYSQGNFVSHQNRSITKHNKNSMIAKRGDSFLLNIYVEKNKKGVYIKRISYTPTWTLVFRKGKSFGFRVVALYLEIKNPFIKYQYALLYFRRKRIILFMKGFFLEEII